MPRREQYTYELELRRVADQLGLSRSVDLEDAIIRHCLDQFRGWLSSYGEFEALSDVVDDFATSLDMRLEEVHSPADIETLLDGMPPIERAAIAASGAEFGESTDALTILRVNRQPWERAYLAIINCQESHIYRRYFSKWHEIVHRLLEGDQLSFAFRETKVDRPEPGELLVDKVAAELAFFPDIFGPVVREECTAEGRLTFASISRVRERVVPEASYDATLRACLRHSDAPVWLLRCSMGMKADEMRRLNSPQMRLIPDKLPEEKLRVREVVRSIHTEGTNVHFHRNMRVPESSIVFRAFEGAQAARVEATETLAIWETSSGGPIGHGEIHVEVEEGVDGEIAALVQLLD